MKKILVSLSLIAAVAVVAVGATGAFFSDTETSAGNSFTAGAIDLKVDSTQHYNGNVCKLNGDQQYVWTGEDSFPVPGTACDGSWAETDLGITNKFFNFADVKPGDNGEDTISLHVVNNDAWVCASVANLTNADNTQTEPEAAVDSNGLTTGELQQAMDWKVWVDNASTSGAIPGDNKFQIGEKVLAEGHPTNGILPLYDSTTGNGPLAAGNTAYLGVSWSLPLATGNEVQTDSMTGDISFQVEQSRNNGSFKCVAPPVEQPVNGG